MPEMNETAQQLGSKLHIHEETAISSPDDGKQDGAIADSDEDDEESIEVRRNMNMTRLQKRQSTSSILRKVIPFHWAPMLSPLTQDDVETCVILENSAFSDPAHCANREKLEYRLRRCDGLCFGLFNTYRPDEAKDWWIETMRHCRDAETGRDDHAKRVMFAHIIATLGCSTAVTDDDMGCPEGWRDPKVPQDSKIGHQTTGRTICLHSFVVAPQVQGVGVGKTAMKSWLELMKESGIADRVALICQASLVEFYQRFGFKHLGPSEVTYAGGGWESMAMDIPPPTLPADEDG